MPKWLKVILIVLVGFVALGGIFVTVINTGMGEIKELSIATVNLEEIEDGTYTGSYSKGRWEWEVVVEVLDHQIEGIKVLSEHTADLASFNSAIVDEVLAAQSLAIDVVSGASINTKAFLKAVENALTN